MPVMTTPTSLFHLHYLDLLVKFPNMCHCYVSFHVDIKSLRATLGMTLQPLLYLC